MKTLAPSLLTTVLWVGTAAGTHAWSCGPSYSGVVRGRYGVCVPPSSQDLLPVFPNVIIQRSKQRYYRNPWIEEYRNRSSNRSDRGPATRNAPGWTRRSSPPYEVTETEAAIQITMDVPGIDMSNLRITLEEADRKIMTVTGRRESAARSATDATTTEWTQTFVLKNPLIQAQGITAQLLNGVLTITLPKEAVPAKNVRSIPIVEANESSDVTISSIDATEKTESFESIAEDDDTTTSMEDTDPTTENGDQPGSD